MSEKKILYRPLYRCPLCGAYGQGDGYTKEQVDDILDKLARGKGSLIVRHNCTDGNIGIMEFLGFSTKNYRKASRINTE